ncbi:hypothetical protein CSA37_04750 [Candidatus Fermentibacteria bacterium]|nr:MAG: hypothetical protein CSA37_04750 [Candidatus Fermentibacteria bacterium]
MCSLASPDALLEKELTGVERSSVPLAVIEMESAVEELSVSSYVMGAASRYVISFLRVIDAGIRTGQGEVMILFCLELIRKV